MPIMHKLSQALELSDEARVITLAAPPFRIVHTNKGWSNVTGFKFVEVVNQSNKVLQGPDTEKENVRMLARACLSGKRSKTHLLNYTKAGDPFINMLEIFPLRDASGALTHFCGVLNAAPAPAHCLAYTRQPAELPVMIRDDTTLGANRSEALAPHDDPQPSVGAAATGPSTAPATVAAAPPRVKRLLNKRVRLADALENQTDAVVLTQPHPPYAITHANGPWCKMCGYTSEEVEGETNAILQGPDTDMGLVSDLMNSVRREEPAMASLVNYKKGGEKFLNQVQVTPVYNEQDELEQFMAMLHEVDTQF